MVEKTAPDSKRDETEASRKREEKSDIGNTFRVLDVRADDVVLEMEDGRAFIATIKDGVDKDEVRRGMKATITMDGLDKTDAPKDAVVTRFAAKDA